MSNYLIYPCEVMKISQTYLGKTSHYNHTIGNYKDYPWDEACKDSGRDYMICPCDEMKIVKIYGVGAKGTNTIWLESTSKVDFADGKSDYVTMLITHPNDDDLKKLKVGQKFERGEKICREGTDGQATGNHFHFSAGKGKMDGNGWIQNSNGKWVLITTKGTYKPEVLFYIDPKITDVKSSNGLKFKEVPVKKKTTTKKKYTKGNYKVTGANLLYVRTGAGTKYPIVRFEKLTSSAQKKIVKLKGVEADGYVKGLTFTVTRVSGDWGKTPSGWVHLGYCTKLK